jgi:hypothetical protein
VTLTTGASGPGALTLDDGTACDSGCTFDKGTKVTLVAKPDDAGSDVSWHGAHCGGTSCALTLDQDLTVTVTFTRPVFALSTAAVNGNGVDCSSVRCGSVQCKVGDGQFGPCAASYPAGSSVTLAAIGQAWGFFHWASDCAGSGTCTLTMNAPHSVSAVFVPPGLQEGPGGPAATTAPAKGVKR